MPLPRNTRFILSLLSVLLVVAIALPWRRLFREDWRLDRYTAMRVSLHGLASAESSFYYEHGRYTASFDSLRYAPVPGVRVALTHADPYGWSVVVTDTRLPTRCTYGDSAPPGPVPSYRAFRGFCVDGP